MSTATIPVVIVGASPAGITAATLLAHPRLRRRLTGRVSSSAAGSSSSRSRAPSCIVGCGRVAPSRLWSDRTAPSSPAEMCGHCARHRLLSIRAHRRDGGEPVADHCDVYEEIII
ncbi:hypothetical protein [Nocardia sp. NPDC004123]